jgi:hypothetical protein
LTSRRANGRAHLVGTLDVGGEVIRCAYARLKPEKIQPDRLDRRDGRLEPLTRTVAR